MSKKCIYWSTSPSQTGRPNGYCGIRCPKGANDKCEIIPKKPRVVRVKAWVSLVESLRTGKCRISDFSLTYAFPCVVPVTILIDEKYLRRKP